MKCDYILDEYTDLLDAWKVYQGVALYRCSTCTSSTCSTWTCTAELVLLFALRVSLACECILSVIHIIYTWLEKTHFVFQGGEEAYKGGEFQNVKVKGWIGDELS